MHACRGQGQDSLLERNARCLTECWGAWPPPSIQLCRIMISKVPVAQGDLLFEDNQLAACSMPACWYGIVSCRSHHCISLLRTQEMRRWWEDCLLLVGSEIWPQSRLSSWCSDYARLRQPHFLQGFHMCDMCLACADGMYACNMYPRSRLSLTMSLSGTGQHSALSPRTAAVLCRVQRQKQKPHVAGAAVT